jgi:hypothetical protein
MWINQGNRISFSPLYIFQMFYAYQMISTVVYTYCDSTELDRQIFWLNSIDYAWQATLV